MFDRGTMGGSILITFFHLYFLRLHSYNYTLSPLIKRRNRGVIFLLIHSLHSLPRYFWGKSSARVIIIRIVCYWSKFRLLWLSINHSLSGRGDVELKRHGTQFERANIVDACIKNYQSSGLKIFRSVLWLENFCKVWTYKYDWQLPNWV